MLLEQKGGDVLQTVLPKSQVHRPGGQRGAKFKPETPTHPTSVRLLYMAGQLFASSGIFAKSHSILSLALSRTSLLSLCV